jgi:hypothetical protein
LKIRPIETPISNTDCSLSSAYLFDANDWYVCISKTVSREILEKKSWQTSSSSSYCSTNRRFAQGAWTSVWLSFCTLKDLQLFSCHLPLRQVEIPHGHPYKSWLPSGWQIPQGGKRCPPRLSKGFVTSFALRNLHTIFLLRWFFPSLFSQLPALVPPCCHSCFVCCCVLLSRSAYFKNISDIGSVHEGTVLPFSSSAAAVSCDGERCSFKSWQTLRLVLIIWMPLWAIRSPSRTLLAMWTVLLHGFRIASYLVWLLTNSILPVRESYLSLRTTHCPPIIRK